MSSDLLFFLFSFINFFFKNFFARQEQYFSLGLLFWAAKQFLWARCFGQLNNSFNNDRLVYGFPVFSCSKQLFYAWKTLYDDVSCVETTFIFSLHSSSFLVLSLYMNSFLPLVVLE